MSAAETFRYLAVSFSMILGLGVTRVLSGLVRAFRARRQVELDWIPFAWAAATFVLQIQFWWAVIELPSLIEHWTLATFLLLLSIPLVLFAAAAMILPLGELAPGENLMSTFTEDGRWGLVFLSAYAAIAFVIDVFLFDTTIASAATLYVGLEFVLPILFLFISRRPAQSVLTGAYVLVILWSSWTLSPKLY